MGNIVHRSETKEREKLQFGVLGSKGPMEEEVKRASNIVRRSKN